MTDPPVKTRKKLIEVALPLDAINVASGREKSIRHGHPSTLHLWWARRPLATARAVIFAQMVDDPSAWPERFPSREAQDNERERLFRIIQQLVLWENTTNEAVLAAARAEIRRSWRDTCEDNKEHPRAAELFNREHMPPLHDPFAGGGTIPLEAQRLGLEAWATDLNPVAVLINKAVLEIPSKFSGRSPIAPLGVVGSEHLLPTIQINAIGLAEDVRRYGAWIREEAERRIGHLYPKVEVTADLGLERKDLFPLVGSKLTVIAWLWARTVKSPNPAFAHVDVPLVSTFLLSTRKNGPAYLEPVIEDGAFRFAVKVGSPSDPEAAKSGTKLSRGAFRCLMSNSPIPYSYIDDEANAGRMGTRLIAIVADGQRGRVYLPATEEIEGVAKSAHPNWKPDTPSRGTWASNAQGRAYGFKTFGDYFTRRQLVLLTTLSDLVEEARERLLGEALASGTPDDHLGLDEGGEGARAYAEAVALYLSLTMSKMTAYHCSLAVWRPNMDKSGRAFGRQGISMVWDFPECNPFAGAGGDWETACGDAAKVLGNFRPASTGKAQQVAAQSEANHVASSVISTDPPYYDNVVYADLSDFFYVWLRRSLRSTFPSLFQTLEAPKAEELVATPYRHGGREQADEFFLDGMTQAMKRLAGEAHPAVPVTIYYAVKQSETKRGEGTASTGWETFLAAVIASGFGLTGTWPMRTEQAAALKTATNSLASSIILVCRPRNPTAAIATRRDFIAALKRELPDALRMLQHGNIAPVDLAQSSIGPGMAIYTRYAKVLDADGSPLSVRDALALINQTLDEALAEQEGDFDADTRWAVAWFAQRGFAEGPFGEADNLSRAKNTSVAGMVEAGVVVSGRGKVRLLRRDELDEGWDPVRDSRLTAWEATHHLMRALDQGEQVAATLVQRLGGYSDTARELAYRLYVICERKKWAQEALSYNALVQSWPEIQRLAIESASAPVQGTLDV